MSSNLDPNCADIAAHLHALFDWALGEAACFELRTLHPLTTARGSRRFSLSASGVHDAVDYAVQSNREHNIYVVPNLLKPGTTSDASDDDVIGMSFNFIDADDTDMAQLDRQIADSGFAPSFSVITGTFPHPRKHFYFNLSTVVTDATLWTDCQKGLAAQFKTDSIICNPARIMRLAGTISYPSKKKLPRGYMVELTQFEGYDDSDPRVVDREAFYQAFPPPQKRAQGDACYRASDAASDGEVPLAVVEAAFKAIPNYNDREQWFTLGAAAKHANPTFGGRAWDDWSRLGTYDADDQTKTWAGFKTKPGGVTRATLFAAAKEHQIDWWRVGGEVEAWWKQRAASHNPCPDDAAGDEQTAEAAPSFPTLFKMQPKGLYYFDPVLDKDGQLKPPLWICSPFRVIGHVATAQNTGCGLVIAFRKRDTEHKIIVMNELLHKDARTLAAWLADLGLKIETHPRQRDLLQQCLNHFRCDRHLISVKTTGWHQSASGKWVFLLSDGSCYGAAADVILQNGDSATNCKVAGTLEAWQTNIAAYAVGNSRLTLFLCAAFVAPLLEICGAESGGIHFYGRSRDGKTTALSIAATVLGRGDNFGYLRSWETTSNALEFVAAASCDCLLAMDEIQQAAASAVQGIIYKILNGSGKLRGRPSGGFRENEKWRTLMLSTGETTPAQRIAETGAPIMAGIDVRLVNIPSDAGKGMGVFEDLHGFDTAADLANHLLRNAKTYYGTPIRAYLTALAEARNDDEVGLIEAIKQAVATFKHHHVPAHANGQVVSVAGRFALIAFAGNLAQAIGVLPESIKPERNAAICFKAWLHERGDVVASEDINVIRQVRRFIQAHGDDRFKPEFVDDHHTPPLIRNQVGFKVKNGDYYILPDQMPEIVPHMTPTTVAKILKQHDLLVVEQTNRLKCRKTIDGVQYFAYHVKNLIVSGDDDAND